MSGRSRFRGLINSKLSFKLQRVSRFGIALKPYCGYSCIGKGSGLTALSIPALGPPGPPLRGKDGAFRATEVSGWQRLG